MCGYRIQVKFFLFVLFVQIIHLVRVAGERVILIVNRLSSNHDIFPRWQRTFPFQTPCRKCCSRLYGVLHMGYKSLFFIYLFYFFNFLFYLVFLLLYLLRLRLLLLLLLVWTTQWNRNNQVSGCVIDLIASDKLLLFAVIAFLRIVYTWRSRWWMGGW